MAIAKASKKLVMNLSSLAKKYDPSGMYSAYASWPEKLRESYGTIKTTDWHNVGKKIAFAAVGGSASAPEIICDWIAREKPLFMPLIKDAELPSYFTKEWTLICVSARGNTEEILLLAKRAYERGSNFAGISSGGKLGDFCRKTGRIHIKIPYEHSPRTSFPFIFNGCMKLLEAMGMISDVNLQLEEIAQSWKRVLETGKIDGSSDSIPFKVARHIYRKLPACYATPSCLPVARRFKNSVNENAKLPVAANSLPEAAHNEMEAVISSKRIAPVLISLRSDSKSALKIMKAVETMYRQKKVRYLRVASEAMSRLVGLLELLYPLELASYYSALLRHVDPKPVPASTAYRANLGELVSLNS